MPEIKLKSKFEGLILFNIAINNPSEKRILSSKHEKFIPRPSKELQQEAIFKKTPEIVTSEMATIRSLWEQLGVVDNYRQVFETVIHDLDISVRKDFLDFEIISLTRFHDQLLVTLI
jgi:valyl-tRNA synthetase